MVLKAVTVLMVLAPPALMAIMLMVLVEIMITALVLTVLMVIILTVPTDSRGLGGHCNDIFHNNLLIDLVSAFLSKDLPTGHGYYRLIFRYIISNSIVSH